MKTIGLLGGMSWESTVEYYRLINELTKARLGGLSSAKLVLYSVDFAEVEALQRAGAWDDAAQLMVDGAKRVERAGADCLLLCTNTMHKTADEIARAIRIPFLHIADCTAEHARRSGLRRLGLLGTRFTMEQEFYRSRLEQLGLSVIVPEADARREIDRVIYEELCLGILRDESRKFYQDVVRGLTGQGAEAVILGCTEIGLLISSPAPPGLVQLLDTTALHCEAAVRLSLDRQH